MSEIKNSSSRRTNITKTLKAVPEKRKKLALALSGCSVRAIAYIGMLEVLEENGFKPDMIAACSSATFVACAYASGTMQQFKEKCLSLSTKEALQWFELSMKGGLLSLDKIDQLLTEFVYAENIEELQMPVAIVAFDLVSGTEVVFSMGNILRAIKASCCIPGLFEPIVWGNKVLIDGSLTNKIPVEAAQRSGADIIVGVDLALNRDFFRNEILAISEGYNFIKKPFKKIFDYIQSSEKKGQAYIFEAKAPGIIKTLNKSVGYIIKARKKTERLSCDLLIEADKARRSVKFERNDLEAIYQEGRKIALAALPKIAKLMEKETVDIIKQT
jgi:predicted acylesterase/phospholipase RssA